MEQPHVLDLPQLYTRPSASQLLSTLSRLALQPHSWDTKFQDSNANGTGTSRTGLPGYLTGIVASSLAWIDDEATKEGIWEAASLRLSERSGRSALPSVSRTFTIRAQARTLDITLHEPSIISDNLGHKTWSASYLLAHRLPLLLPSYLPSSDNSSKRPSVLELGAGTGLVGIAASAIFGTHVHLTDLPAITSNLSANVLANTPTVITPSGGSTRVSALDWSAVSSTPSEEKYDIILVADPLYCPEHPAWLVNTIISFLKKAREARVVVELPIREAYMPQVEEMRTRMGEGGLVAVEDGTENGVDDWGGGGEVRCWFGMWIWREV